MPTANAGFSNEQGMLGYDALTYHGPTLEVQIGYDFNFRIDDITDRPNLPQTPLFALVDTGATESCIDSTLALNLGLTVVDRKRVAGVHGARPVNYHVAQIYIPSLDFTIVGTFPGADLTASGLNHSALLGRTFLQHFKMTYEGRTGSVIIGNDGAAGELRLMHAMTMLAASFSPSPLIPLPSRERGFSRLVYLVVSPAPSPRFWIKSAMTMLAARHSPRKRESTQRCTASFSPSPLIPLPSRERGFCRLFRLSHPHL